MSEHLSSLDLDVLAAGLSTEGAAHILGCPACRGRLDALQAENARIKGLPRFEQVRSQVVRQKPPPLRRARWAIPAMALAGVGGLLIALRPSPPEIRPKGSPELQIERLGAAGQTRSGPPFHPGEKVRLAVNPLGHRYALVLAVDAAGQVERLWPPEGSESGLTTGSWMELDPPFEVTAGSLILHAFFFDRPVPARTAIDAVQQALADARGRGTDVFHAQPPFFPAEQGHATRMLEVIAR